MIKWMLLFGSVVALGDLILMYYIYAAWGFGVAFLVAVLPVFIGARLIRACKPQRAPSDNPVGAFGDELLFFAASMLFLYPGPLSTFCGLLLLIPFVRRAIQARALRAFSNAVAAGNVTIVSNARGFGGTGSSGFGGAEAPMQDFKPAEGKGVGNE